MLCGPVELVAAVLQWNTLTSEMWTGYPPALGLRPSNYFFRAQHLSPQRKLNYLVKPSEVALLVCADSEQWELSENSITYCLLSAASSVADHRDPCESQAPQLATFQHELFNNGFSLMKTENRYISLSPHHSLSNPVCANYG